MLTDVSKWLWVEVGFERLVGLGGERVRLSRFLVVGMRESCNGFTDVGVSVAARRGNAMDFGICVARANLPPGKLLMVEAFCGVGQN